MPDDDDGSTALIEQMFSEPGGETVTDHTVDSVLLVTGWFKRYAAEKARLMSKAGAGVHPGDLAAAGYTAANRRGWRNASRDQASGDQTAIAVEQ